MNKNDNVGPKRQTGLWLSLGHKPVGLVVQEGTVAAKGKWKRGRRFSWGQSHLQKLLSKHTTSQLQLQLQL